MGPLIRLKTDTVERIQSELAKLEDQGAALSAEIERLTAREDELETGNEMLAAMAGARAAQNRLRKIDRQIAETRERLDLAKDAARTKLRADLLAAFDPAARDFLTKAWAAQEALGRVVAAREALLIAGFRDVHASLPVPPALNHAALLAPDLLKIFETRLDPAPRIPARRTSAQPSPRNPGPRPRLPHERQEHGAATYIGNVGAARPEKRPPLRETAAEGEILFSLHRGLLEHPRKGKLQAGDVVAMTLDEARPLILSRSGDIVTAEEQSRLDAAAALNSAAPTTAVA